MATKMERQAARRKAREIKIEEQKKLEEQLRRKSDAREEVFLRLAQVDSVHAAAGKALQALLDSGDSKDELAEIFGLSKAGVDGYLRAAREADRAEDESSDDSSESTADDSPEQDDQSLEDERAVSDAGVV